MTSALVQGGSGNQLPTTGLQVFRPSATSARRCCSMYLARSAPKRCTPYDFGDSWEHGIAIEKVLTPEPGLAYPVCMGGKRHGPPEDCGGVPGYYHLLEALSDPDHERHEELREWMGDDFDPEAFSVDDVNRRLAPLQRRRTKNKDA